MPNTLLPALKQALYGTLLIGTMVFVTPYINQGFLTQEWFLSYNFLVKLGITHCILLFVRFKYYGGWKFAQAGINAAGISYNGIDEKTGLI